MIKKVYYINLDERADRRAAFLREMDRYGLKDVAKQVVRFPAVKTSPGYVGCSWSHVGVLKQALSESDDPYVIVLEDDFSWKLSPAVIDKTLKEFFSHVGESSWDVLVFGAPPYDLQTSASGVPGIRKCHKAQTTTGYMVRRGYVEKLISIFELSAQKLEAGGNYQTWALDQVWKKLQMTDSWFITVPGFGKQVGGLSDIEKRTVEYPFI